MSTSIWIVIVNYRTPALVVNCLRSLAIQRPEVENLRVVVVDNDSRDGSVEHLASVVSFEHWDEWATIVPNERNGGFAYGNNVGIRMALDAPIRVDFVMLLNPDTVARPGSVCALIDIMQLNENKRSIHAFYYINIYI